MGCGSLFGELFVTCLFDLLKSCEDLVSLRHAIAGQPCQVVEIAAVVGAHITEERDLVAVADDADDAVFEVFVLAGSTADEDVGDAIYERLLAVELRISVRNVLRPVRDVEDLLFQAFAEPVLRIADETCARFARSAVVLSKADLRERVNDVECL